jgi:hypothetical protein
MLGGGNIWYCHIMLLCTVRMGDSQAFAPACQALAHLARRMYRAWAYPVYCNLQLPPVLLYFPLSYQYRDISLIPILDLDYWCHHDRNIYRD